MEELIFMLRCIYPLSPGLEARLRSIIRLRLFRKGEYLVEIGEIARDILYVRQGLVRGYRLVSGKEKSKWFMKEGNICIAVVSFLRQCPSTDAVMALEDCECWGITHVELEETYVLFPEFNIHGRLITGEYYCLAEIRYDAILGETPEDKYARLMEVDPELVRRVANKHLASFLNVGDRTFNKIRKRYLEERKCAVRRARRRK